MLCYAVQCCVGLRSVALQGKGIRLSTVHHMPNITVCAIPAYHLQQKLPEFSLVVHAALLTTISGLTGKGNVQIWGTQPKSIDDAEDRDKWYDILTKLDIKQPPGGMCTDEASALDQSKKLGFPVMVRPSFVLGGRAMEIVYR